MPEHRVKQNLKVSVFSIKLTARIIGSLTSIVQGPREHDGQEDSDMNIQS